MKLRRDLAEVPLVSLLALFRGDDPQGHDQIIRTGIVAMTAIQQAAML
jgi:hypothetical protein